MVRGRLDDSSLLSSTGLNLDTYILKYIHVIYTYNLK